MREHTESIKIHADVFARVCVCVCYVVTLDYCSRARPSGQPSRPTCEHVTATAWNRISGERIRSAANPAARGAVVIPKTTHAIRHRHQYYNPLKDH